MQLSVTKVVLLAMLAVSAVAMPGLALADATQPAVARPEVTQFRIDRAASGDCDMISVGASSDESLFGSNGSDGVR